MPKGSLVMLKKDLKKILSGKFLKFKDIIAPQEVHEYIFEVKSNKLIPIGFELSNIQDDIDISLWELNNKKTAWDYISASKQSGKADEYIFSLLSSGKYLLEVKHENSFSKKDLPSKYQVSFDAKYVAKTIKLPNDPLFNTQWHLLNTGQSLGSLSVDVRAPEAWKRQSGSPNITVAVIDGGVDLKHPDLINNIWLNQKEIADNGIDDDKNGFIDDINGWNFVDSNSSVIPSDHGTHVAGIIGAEGNNNIGVTGVTWDVNIMSLDIFGGKTKYDKENFFDAIYYAVDNGADIINMSIGYTVPFATLDNFKQISPDLYQEHIDVLNYAVEHEVTLVTSAGNDNSDDISSLSIPAAFATEVPGFISVAAITDEGKVADYSNFGGEVTIAAPGGSAISKKSKIISTLPSDKGVYGGMPGTSMAAPVVSGAIALMLEKNENLLPEDIAWILDETSTKDSLLQRFVKSSGYLTIDKAINAASKYNPKMKNNASTNGQQYTNIFLYGNDAENQFQINEKNFSQSGGSPTLINFNPIQGDKLFINKKILPDFNADDFLFTQANNKRNLMKQSKSNSNFVYDQRTGNLYFNQNKKSKGWTDGKNNTLLARISGAPYMNENIIFINKKNGNNSISSSPNRLLPLEENIGDTKSAKYLFKKSGQDFQINYFIDEKGLHDDHDVPMDHELTEYIEKAFHSLDENTLLKFDKTSFNKADFVIGAKQNPEFVGVNERSWGLSVVFDLIPKLPYTTFNQYNSVLEIASALGVSRLPEKLKGIYSFTDTVAAWPPTNDLDDYENHVGITSNDFDAINHVWNSFL
jgi:subtilisin family serine protease